MKIGYLHIGSPKHGICRYGRILASAAARNENLNIIEASVTITDNYLDNKKKLVLAAQKLSQADVVHLQFSRFNKGLWGEGKKLINHLKTFLNYCSSPIIVTLHDVFYPQYSLNRLIKLGFKGSEQTKFSLLEFAIEFRRAIKNFFEPDLIALRKLSSKAKFFMVCTSEEASRLREHVEGNKLIVVPHFVEAREISNLNYKESRRQLNLPENNKIITLLGFIYPTKGHELLIESLAKLPKDIQVVFAGGSSSEKYEHYVEELWMLARQKKVNDRLRITGYLSEIELEKYLVATDLAVCPFSRFSASGSVSTWISAKCPILTSDFPQINEYNSLVQGAIQIFSPYSADALAVAIIQSLGKITESKPKVAQLRKKLLITNILERHLAFYKQAIDC